ncbi:MAG TPA: DUF2975 domain-containing protein [Vicinamibacterales bacterium]|nr:DUF2975 domain-containing protein [Vicinamibacterales bacterium]
MAGSAGARSVSSFLATLLTVVWYALAIVIGLTICLVLAGSSAVVQVDLSGGGLNLNADRGAPMTVPVAVTIDADRIPIESSLPDDGRAALRDVRGSLAFAPPPGVVPAAALAAAVILLAFALWVIGELRAVFRSFRHGRPFVPANVRRIRMIGWAMIVGEVVRTSIVAAGSAYAMHHFSANGLRFEVRPDFNVMTVIGGLIVLALAEAFREGVRLDEDRSLTI